MYINKFSFGELKLTKYLTLDELCNSKARPMTLRCVFNKDFLVNQSRVIFYCSYIWLCSSDTYRSISQKNITFIWLQETWLLVNINEFTQSNTIVGIIYFEIQA